MASLENKKIKDTYQGLLKTDDNAAIDGAVEITDGAGNGTGVTISNDGQVTATGTVSFGSLKDTGEDITVTKFVDEADGIGNNDNDTSIPTSAAVKDYVDTNVTAQDLDFQGDSGTGAVDLDSQSLDIAGGTGIDTSAVDQTLTVNIDSTVATLTGTQTLTNKSIDLTDNTLSGTTAEFNTALSDDDFATLAGTETLTNKTVDADNNTVSNLEVDNLKSGVLDTDLTSVSASDDTLASAKAIKTYVDSNITAQDLDITDGTTTSAVDLDSQTLTIEGTANEVEVSLTDQTFTVGLPTSITTNVTGNLTGNVTGNVTGNLTGNVTGDVTGNADTASALETARTISLSGDVAGSVSFDGSANADITATIQANSVALGTDTTGDYVENLGVGTGVTIGSNTGEGSSPTISVDYGSTANTAVQGDTSLTIQGTANEIEVTGGGVTLGSGGTVTVGLPDDVSLGGSLTIAQNLTVNGTTTTVNTDTLSVEDPLIELARDNSENSVDVGLYGKYSLDSGVTTKYSGLFKDASDSDKFKLFKGLEVEPTSTVDTSGTGYTKGDLVINDLDAVDGVFSGDLTVDTNTLKVDSTNNRVGIRTSSPSSELTVNGQIEASSDTTTPSGGNAYFYKSSAGAVVSGYSTIIETGGLGSRTERLRVDNNGNVGIGKTPSTILDVKDSGSYATVSVSNTGTTGGGSFRVQQDSVTSGVMCASGAWLGDTSNDIAFASETSKNIRFFTNGSTAEAMRIDSSGNVGIGTTNGDIFGRFYTRSVGIDSAGITKIQIDGASYTGIDFGVNGTRNGEINNTSTSFGINTIDARPLTFTTNNTERMRIDSSGNVGIGTASPDSKFHIGLSNGSQLRFDYQGSGDNYYDGATHYFRNTNGNSNIMTLLDGGNVGIGTTSPSGGKLHIYATNTPTKFESSGLTLYNTYTNSNGNFGFIGSGNGVASGGNANDFGIQAVNNFVFATGGSTERMRITSGGDVLVGTTSDPSASVTGFKVGDGTSGTFVNNAKNVTTSTAHFNFFNPNGVVGSISTSGSATAYNTSSDYRLKENVVDLTGALDRVDQLEPKRFNFIADEDTTVDGFLAHEVQDIVPEAVTGEKDATEEYEVSPEVLDDEGNVVEEAVMGTRDVYQGIDQSKLVPLLVGAIKELRAEVNSLKAQINN